MTTYSFTLYDLCGDLKENEFRDARNQIAYLIRPASPSTPTFQFPSLPSPTEITRQSDWGIALEHEPWKATLTYGEREGLGVSALPQCPRPTRHA